MITKTRCFICFTAVLALLAVSSASYAAEKLSYGLNAITEFEKLPYLKHETWAGQTSSFSRKSPDDCWTDCQSDSFDRGNYLYSIDDEEVLLDLAGPGVVYRMWFTKSNLNSNPIVRIYLNTDDNIDGDLVYEGDFNSTFSGKSAPFLAPLVMDRVGSSGGWVSYLPIPFSAGIRVTLAENPGSSVTDDNGAYFYNFGFHQFSPDTEVENWTGTENSQKARNAWYQAGIDPKPFLVGTTTSSGTRSFKTSPLTLNYVGPKTVQSIKFRIPGVFPNGTGLSMSDTGKAFKGQSSFNIAIDRDNQGVLLKRRLDYTIANQKASVYVDNQFAGTWVTPGSDSAVRWRESTFYIPGQLTAGKTRVSIRVQFASSGLDWNEFYYWVYSLVGSEKRETDTLDVGNASSETAHSYTVSQLSWQGTRSYKYPTTSADAASILSSMRLKIKWDGESGYSVDAPFNLLFATGNNNVYPTRSLPVGIDDLGFLYIYFPMPFKTSAQIRIEGNGTNYVPSAMYYEVTVAPNNANFDDLAYFKTVNKQNVRSVAGEDLPILDVEGQGHFVGNVISYYSGDDRGNYLEGDERIHVDGSLSPDLHGTGAEDYFNGGWYCSTYKFFSNPLSGLIGSRTGAWIQDKFESSTFYRFMIQDAIPFKSEITVSIEHGNRNEQTVQADILAFYYGIADSGLVGSDFIQINHPEYEGSHGYIITGQTWEGSRSYSFEGDDGTVVTSKGRAFGGANSSSRFRASIEPDNQGVVLFRMFDQNIGRQRAEVFVDGSYVGDWYYAGKNTHHSWRMERFFIPSSFTAGKNTMEIRLKFKGSDLDWNEFRYFVVSYTP